MAILNAKGTISVLRKRSIITIHKESNLSDILNSDDKISVPNQNENPNESNRSRYMKQALIVSNASLWCITIAMFEGWSNPASYDFIKIGTNIYGDKIEFSDTQLDMLSGMSNVGNILGSAYVWPVTWWGRRSTLMFLVVPATIAWAIIGFSPSPVWILVGRVMSGFCGNACEMAVNTYMVEIPDVNIRGTIAMVSQLIVAAGFLLTFSLGLVFRYYHYAYLGIGLAIVTSFLNYFIPESPTYLVTQNREDEARKILKSLRSPKDDLKIELEMLKNDNKGTEDSSFKHLFKQTNVRKNLGIVLTLFFFQLFSGLDVFYLHTTRIFIDAGTNINENQAVIYTFIFQFLGTFVGLLTIDKIGRRYSLVISFILVSLCTYILGAYFYFYESSSKMNDITDIMLLNATAGNTIGSDIYNLNMSPDVHQWVPIICLMGFVFSASLGIESIPFILSVEYFPTSVRAQAESICMVFASVMSMSVFSLYSPMKTALTTSGLYFFYATFGAFGSIFSLIFISETSGQNIG